MGVRCQPERRHFECLGADPTGRCRGKWVTFDGNTPPKEGAALLGKEWGCLVHDRRMPHVQKEDRRFKRKATRFIRTNCEKRWLFGGDLAALVLKSFFCRSPKMKKQQQTTKKARVSAPVAYAAPSTLAPDALLKAEHIASLQERGFAVVPNVLDAAKCATLKQQWLATMSMYEGSGFDPVNRATWTSSNLPTGTRGMQEHGFSLFSVFFIKFMLVSSWPPVAHEPWMWEARLAAAPVFASLWGCPKEELISSMDRACFVPYTRLKINKGNAGGWVHIDQSAASRRGTLECVQGFVTLNDIGPGEVALTVYEGAHKHHSRFFSEHLDAERSAKCATSNWLKFEEADKAWYLAQNGVKETRVHAPAGSLVLWESRLPHHAMPPETQAARSQIDRYVIYTCMVPRIWASEEALKKRIAAFEKGRATTHWPQDAKLFALKPRTYGGAPDEVLLDPHYDPVTKQVAKLPGAVSDFALVQKLVGYS